LRHGSPCKCPPICVSGDGRVFIEPLELHIVVLGHVEEGAEGLNAGAFLLEELDDRLPFLLVGGAGAGQKVRCSGEADMRLVVEEIVGKAAAQDNGLSE
jgi:hypothetical protein